MPERIIIPKTVNHNQFTINYLKNNGYEPHNVLWRKCKDQSRIDIAMKTGTDRDETSEISFFPDIKTLGLLGLGPKDITYANPLGYHFQIIIGPFMKEHFQILFDHKKMENYLPGINHFGQYLYKPKEGFNFLDAAIAVITIEDYFRPS